MMRIPVTVVSGYLGAGKTTLINRLLSEEHGLRLMILVNDFGAINIDASLIEASDDETIALTNGCVCCSMESDLQQAVEEALSRDPRPDHIVIEASGIADPAAIANAARAEPELGYAGVITLVDGLNAAGLLDDPLIAPQVAQQIRAADLVLVTKCESLEPSLTERLVATGARKPVLPGVGPLSELLFDIVPLPRGRQVAAHPGYTAWQHHSACEIGRAEMGEKLANRPEGLYRLKGTVLTDDGAYQVQVVGRYVEARRTRADHTSLVGLGPAERLSADEIESWWQGSDKG